MNKHRFWQSCLVGVALVVSAAQSAATQDRFAVEAFEPAPMTHGSVLSVFGARELPAKGYTLTVLGSYGDKPLTLERSDNQNQLGSLAGSVGTLAFMGAVGLGSRVDVGVALPLHRIGEASGFGSGVPSAVSGMRVSSSQVALGDIRIAPRLSLLARERESGIGLAVITQFYLPTGKESIYAGESFRLEPRIALDWRSRSGVLLALNVGYLIRSRATLLDARVDDALRAAVGTEVPLFKGLSGLLEVGTSVNVMTSNFSRVDAPTEGFLGVRYSASGITAQLGGGPGLVRGLTAPTYRLALGVSFTGMPAPAAAPPVEVADDCETNPGLCPQPVADRDGDAMPDSTDKCPGEAEDADGYQDTDGCPDLDDDKDGIADAADSCKNEPEDRDGFQDADGCPDRDNDGDQVADADDRCPSAAGPASEHGCPAATPAAVVVADKAIELRESVYFESNRATIDARSAPLLDELASVLKAHAEIQSVVIEGHTDDRGNAQHNRDLSKQRATAVLDALVQRGVAADRLRAEGLGPDHPIVANDNEEHRAKNRRVALRIERRAQ